MKRVKRGKLTFEVNGVVYDDPFTILGKDVVIGRQSWTPALFDGESDPCFVRTNMMKIVNRGEKLNLPD